MRKYFSALTVIFLFSIQLSAQVTDTTLQSFGFINQTVQEKIEKYGGSQVLVVLDVDNTLLKSDTDLGSDLWYRWQRNKLDIKPTSKQKLPDSCLFSEAIPLLYELGTMSLTEPELANYIVQWQQKGVTLIALTSRSPLCRAATERDLKQNGIELKKNALTTLEGNSLELNYSLKRELTYANGLMMTSGMHKGEMLAHLLGRSGKTFQAILFVDDTRKNIDNVKAKYTDFHSKELSLLYYTKVFSEREKQNNGQLLTQKQADKMASDWSALLKSLNQIFPERVNKCKCVTQP